MNDKLPSAEFLRSLFHRRGIENEYIQFYDIQKFHEEDDFYLNLSADETPVISVLGTQYNLPSWLTTKRFAWGKSNNRQEFLLNEIKHVNLFLDKNREKSHSLGIKIDTFDEKEHKIFMPDTGVLNGFLAIFKKFVR